MLPKTASANAAHSRYIFHGPRSQRWRSNCQQVAADWEQPHIRTSMSSGFSPMAGSTQNGLATHRHHQE
ncbi:hypothetical protein KL935_000511 [Ogataea polymorpha]|nr:hypothetical protein KL937_000038 [Ogataea polymorpha]KAG7904372.1 hypothetical protein KL935_000511 [Ogataea polymorpha]KAG7940648.1 hypothetical protein KL904_000511 [Ogataea polymorpha]